MSLSPSGRKSNSNTSVEAKSDLISRSSGLAATAGTFGNATRFPDKLIGKGCESPRGDNFYSHVQLYRKESERGLSCSLSCGPRSRVECRSSPALVGPGSYSFVGSVTKSRSPLDGPEFCTTTLKAKLGSSLVPKGNVAPSPATYNIRRSPDAHLPAYGGPRMKYGGRPRSMEDNDGPGFDYNSHNLKSGAIWMVSPSPRGDLSALESATGGSKKHLKSTFGTSQRFKDGRGHGSATPSGNMYYAHSRLLNGEDYLTGGGATSLGFGTKVDFSNPLRHSPANKNHVSPASYSPVLIGGATSALDGFTVRATTSPAMVSRGATRPASPASPAAKRS
mmetsp:Transcript_72795/g.196951  ORF Transcript_72795/g.196951 Transcript_72795/m.196951 type:complete len:335 (+) Transcript_72795:107-1111(+)